MALHSRDSACERLNSIALCAGYGGLELGLHIAEPGYRTVCFVEREAAAAAALVARMADAALDQAPVWDDLKTFDGRPWRGRVHLVTGGYPCQPFSSAGRRKGTDDPRHLWPHIAGIVADVRPKWCFFENVQGHLDLGLPEVASGLSQLGYRVKAGLFTAQETGAAHQRARLFILAHADRLDEWQQGRSGNTPGHSDLFGQKGRCRQTDSADRSAPRVDAALDDAEGAAGDTGAFKLFAPAPDDLRGWRQFLNSHPDHEPSISRQTHGVAERVDRYRAAGNGVCSMAAALAWRTLKADFERDWTA